MATCNDFWERDDGGGEYQQKWLTFTWTTLSTFSWFSRHSEHHSLCHEHKHIQGTSRFLNITFDIKYIDLDKITWLTEWCNSTCWWATAITKVLLIQECKLWVQFLSYCTYFLHFWERCLTHRHSTNICSVNEMCNVGNWKHCHLLDNKENKALSHSPLCFCKKKQTTPKFSIIP